ncbi:hypothetical protein [Anaeromicrobium sediminis]|uniref:Flagellar protein FliT n=1 Tax=Anaeromicrobium sediminis TaxID=1478221 RepID=A0A267MMH8_9FIRM|nr:hypothetical protein [Anaeromicrobium sediminis]PAB60118.1 hypothetical protein CCE28_07035 [Anaeromicrobium sediminis]
MKKTDCVEALYENLLLQKKSIEDGDTNELIELLKNSKALVDEIKKMDISCDESIKSRIKDIHKIYDENYRKSKSLQEKIGYSIRKINLGKKAIFNGYLKRQEQSHGYFVDKRVGKGYRY